MLIRELPQNERPREKLMYKGAENLSSSELLAIFIRTGSRSKTAIDLAEEILSMDSNGLIHLINCSVEDLSKIRGIGNAKACSIKAAIELGKRIATQPRNINSKVESVDEVVNMFMERMRDYDKEHFKLLLLNSKGKIICEDTISIGDISSSIVHPRETFKEAIKRNAAAIILVHNHPSGNPKPSREDIDVTKRLINAGEILGIKIVDHIIIGDGEYVSFKKNGMI